MKIRFVSKYYKISMLTLLVGISFTGSPAQAFFNSTMLSKKNSAPQPRLISNSYYTDWLGPVFKSSAGMSRTTYEISTTGVANGDLLLIIASIDNGSDTLWPNPIATGYTQLYQKVFGNDGATFSVQWKIASGEPSTYTGTYGPGIISGSATISLIAISGANSSTPINASQFGYGTGSDISPAVGTSAGVTTTANNCLIIYASGADWNGSNDTSAFTQPTGYSMLTHLGDHGTDDFDWTTQQISFIKKSATGATGVITSTETVVTKSALSWTAVIAIAPP